MIRVIGLMSGTSLDGVDAAWLETDGHVVGRTGAALTLPYDDGLRADLRRLLDRAPGLSLDDPFLTGTVARLTEMHARAVAELGMAADLIGFHGQTILHDPARGRSWQVGDAGVLAARTGLPVAHDFRSADIAAGGEGAPLAPVFHAALARGLPQRLLSLPVAILNVGGVANVTWIGPGPDDLVAFDTGPGNGPLDDWVMTRTGQAFDEDGRLARAGRPHPAVLGTLLAHQYFARPAPKSLDRLDFSRALRASGLDELSDADGAATLVAFTAGAVGAARKQFPAPPSRWLVCGGGRRNAALMDALRVALEVEVAPVEALGWDGDAMEARCFAFLAARVQGGLPLSYPGTTGVPHPLPGGKIAAPPPQKGAGGADI